jgi:hypothetical protein
VGGLAAISGWAAADVELHGMPFLSPGMFVRVRLPMGQPHRALMIPEEALGSDQGQRVVLVVKEDNTVESRTVVLGPQDDQLRAIESGIKEGERVIVRGQQRVRPGGKVTPPVPRPARLRRPAVGPEGGREEEIAPGVPPRRPRANGGCPFGVGTTTVSKP